MSSDMGDEDRDPPVLGIESSDDGIREGILRKAMPRTAIIRVFHDLSELAAEYGDDRVGLDVNILIGGPGTMPETAVDDAVDTALFALKTGDAHGVQVDLNLHPYYIGARGIARFPGRALLERDRRWRGLRNRGARPIDGGLARASSSGGRMRVTTASVTREFSGAGAQPGLRSTDSIKRMNLESW